MENKKPFPSHIWRAFEDPSLPTVPVPQRKELVTMLRRVERMVTPNELNGSKFYYLDEWMWPISLRTNIRLQGDNVTPLFWEFVRKKLDIPISAVHRNPANHMGICLFETPDQCADFYALLRDVQDTLEFDHQRQRYVLEGWEWSDRLLDQVNRARRPDQKFIDMIRDHLCPALDLKSLVECPPDLKTKKVRTFESLFWSGSKDIRCNMRSDTGQEHAIVMLAPSDLETTLFEFARSTHASRVVAQYLLSTEDGTTFEEHVYIIEECIFKYTEKGVKSGTFLPVQ
jgi:hypothetical protein